MPSQQPQMLHSECGSLEAVLHLPNHTPSAIVVVAHPLPIMGGTMDNKVVTTLCRAFSELGYACLRFNFRGVGQSSGLYDQGNGEVNDVICAVNFMRQRYPDLPLICAGFSFGAYVQARATQETQPQKLLLIAPAVGRFAMPNVASNTTIIHGDQDEVVALKDLFDWASPQQLAITVVCGTGHYFHGRLPQLKQLVMQHCQLRQGALI